jgi:hypothetical protein
MAKCSRLSSQGSGVAEKRTVLKLPKQGRRGAERQGSKEAEATREKG